jgi:hypothetical protein
MPWPASPENLGAVTSIPFIQADWMGANPELVGNTPMTSPGVCMALTTQLFCHHKRGGAPEEFFAWLGTNGGAITTMALQTDYMMKSLGTDDPNAKISLSITSMLGSFRRAAEDDLYKASGFVEVDSPFLPSVLGYFSTLPSQVVARHGDAGCLYKPIYMAAVSGSAHTIGAILDYARNSYIFFDSNNGFVEFFQPELLRSFVDTVQDEYAAAYSAYFIDTKS